MENLYKRAKRVESNGVAAHDGDSKLSLASDSSSLKFIKNEFLTTDEAADFLRLSKQSLLNMSSNGKVPYYKLGNRNRFRLQDLQELLLRTRRGGFNGY